MDKVKEIIKLGALNLRQDPTKLEDWECVKLVNLDISRKPGSLVLRRGRELLYNVSSSEVVRQIAKINGKRYQVAGEFLYRDGTAIVRDLSINRETNFQAFRPLDDRTIWAFVADDNLMFKDDGTRTYLWGIDILPTPHPQLANQTGKLAADTIDAGDYEAVVTQIRWDDDTVAAEGS